MTEIENTAAQTQTAATAKRHSGVSRLLNKYFHHIDRGGTLKGEVMAGLTAFFIAICVIFMNVQVIAAKLGVTGAVETSPLGPQNIAGGTTIASLYIASVLVAFIGSLVIGLIARLPFVQTSMMGLGSSMICLAGTSGGLTYYNLLFVSLIAAVIYAVAVSVPVVRRFVFNAVPAPIRKVLPAATGLIVAFTCLQASGVVSAEHVAVGGAGAYLPSLTTGAALSAGGSVVTIAFAAAFVAIALFFALKFLKLKHPVFWSFVGGTLVYIVVMIVANGIDTAGGSSFVNFGRLWVMVSSQASAATPFGDSYFSYIGDGFGDVFANFGRVFSEGAQFAEGVSAGSFVISGVLCYLFLGMFDARATLSATEDDINNDAGETAKVDFDSEKGARLALICNAGMNVVAPFLGVGGVTISKSSVAATRDNGKSGLVSVVAALGFLVALFVWAFPFLFATQTNVVGSMNEYNYNAYGNGGFIECFGALSFGVADAVLFAVGVTMLKSLGKLDFYDAAEWLPGLLTVVASLVFTNLAYGVAVGVLVWCLAKLLSFRKTPGDKWLASLKTNFLTGVKEIGVPTAALGALLLVMLILA